MEVTFEGYVAKDAVLRTIDKGDKPYSVCNIWVGEHLGRSNVPETESKTAWRKVTLWREYAEKMAPYLKKGRKIEIRYGYAGEADSYTRRLENGQSQVVPFLPVTIGRNGKIFFRDAKPEDNLPPEDVLSEEPAVNPVAIDPEDMPF